MPNIQTETRSLESTPPTAKRVLIVEDDVDIRNLIRVYLKKMQLGAPIEADDGESALKILESEKVDLIISDLYMPHMDGIDFFKALHQNQNLKDIPFLMISADSSKTRITEVMMLGIRNYIIKPIDPDNMMAKVKRLLKLDSN